MLNLCLGLCQHAHTPCSECGQMLPFQVYGPDDQIGLNALMEWLADRHCTPPDLVAAVRHYEQECSHEMPAEADPA